MKKSIIIVLLAATVAVQTAAAFEVSGQWVGRLNVSAMRLRVVLNLTMGDSSLTATMDSPDQGAKGIAVSHAEFRDSVLRVKIDRSRIDYCGKLSNDSTIIGTFTQNGNPMPLTLVRAMQPLSINRPQTPQPPYPYIIEEVTFDNEKANLTLAGTLTLPLGRDRFPIVVLVSGSGPQDRDEQIAGHRPFHVIADYFARNGIGVLRYDDRGMGGSAGYFSAATTVDHATDAMAAVDYLRSLKSLKKHPIGVVGHSEGAVIAPMIAAWEPSKIDFVVMMAGVGLQGDKLMLLQKQMLEQQLTGGNTIAVQLSQMLMGGLFKVLRDRSIDTVMLQDSVRSYLGTFNEEPQLSQMVAQLSTPWFVGLIRLNPAEYLSKVQCPVLAINGSKDLQVSAKENLEGIAASMQHNKGLTVHEFEGLNHLFQECTTGMPDEYGVIEQTFTPHVLEFMSRWIAEQNKK